MGLESGSRSLFWALGFAGILAVCTLLLARVDHGLVVLWPSFAALLLVFLARNAFLGLLSGAFCGSILLAEGNLIGAFRTLGEDQFLPIFSSEWKLSAIFFTLILGGFVALVEAGGGLQALIGKLLGPGRAAAKRMQLTVFGFGLLVFFDGLANTMLLGRMLRSAADRCGVSRVKLAYLADTTGSAVACLAFISTWIAFQLSMIREGYESVGVEVSAYALFFKSLPVNFYCWFALALAIICVVRDFNPGPMGKWERDARKEEKSREPETVSSDSSHWLLAIVPILVLTLSIPLLSYLIGSETLLPITLSKFADAYAEAEAHVPRILVASSLLAAFVAALGCWVKNSQSSQATVKIPAVFMSGVRDLLKPIGILFAAWMLGAAISQLGAASLLSELLEGRLPLPFLPVVIFGLGAAISFSTGTSWGTMGVLMPLAIPVVFTLTGDFEAMERESFVVAAIGAVFSGAVFGDHCSPFSDTTIVSSIGAGVKPLDHFSTQLPFAVIAALAAAVFGFIPLGFGLPAWLCLLLGAGLLFSLPSIFPKHREHPV
ncbi:MAG: Na+/H+ antiporter NhaC family protein [Verrucomicrobiota bacterium]